MAFTLALLVGFTGSASPLAVLIVGVAMFLASMGYASLNRWKASAGAPYVWVGEAITPAVGYGTGFLNALTSTLANVGNITLAGGYLLFVISPTNTFGKPITWIVAAVIMAVLLWLAISGTRPTVWLQLTFIFIEYAAIISFVILALIHESGHTGGATLPSWSNFSLSGVVGGVGGFKGLAEAAVVCGFLYLGWEATANLGGGVHQGTCQPGPGHDDGHRVPDPVVHLPDPGVPGRVEPEGRAGPRYRRPGLRRPAAGTRVPWPRAAARGADRRAWHQPDPDGRAEPRAVRHGPGQADPRVLRVPQPQAPDGPGRDWPCWPRSRRCC